MARHDGPRVGWLIGRGHTYDVRADLAAENVKVDNHCGFGGV